MGLYSMVFEGMVRIGCIALIIVCACIHENIKS